MEIRSNKLTIKFWSQMMISRMIFTLLTIFMVASVLFSACAQYTVKTDYDPEANFSSYRSFSVIEPQLRANANPLVMKRIVRAIRDELITKGFREATRSQADMLVTIHGSKQDVIDINTTRHGYGYSYGYQWTEIDVQQYTEGSLFIDIAERQAKELVWRGAASGVLGDEPGRDEQKVRDVISKILESFPPGMTKSGQEEKG
jgi:hypothetical protein